MNMTGALMEPGAAMVEKNVAGDSTLGWESEKAQWGKGREEGGRKEITLGGPGGGSEFYSKCNGRLLKGL